MPQVDDAVVDDLVTFATWADKKSEKVIAKRPGDLAEKKGSDLVLQWVKELTKRKWAVLSNAIGTIPTGWER